MAGTRVAFVPTRLPSWTLDLALIRVFNFFFVKTEKAVHVVLALSSTAVQSKLSNQNSCNKLANSDQSNRV